PSPRPSPGGRGGGAPHPIPLPPGEGEDGDRIGIRLLEVWTLSERKLDELTATAILGIDTLWGGDVMNPSGTGRFIADSWFADEPLPAAYTPTTALKVRQTGGVSGKPPDVAA